MLEVPNSHRPGVAGHGDHADPPALIIGQFRTDPARFALIGPRGEVRLRPLPFRFLLYLALHAPRIVPASELFDCVWGDEVVSDWALAAVLRDLRRTLGDDARRPRYIRTRRRLGYQLVASVGSAGSPTVSVLEGIDAALEALAECSEQDEVCGLLTAARASLVEAHHLDRAASDHPG